MNHFGCRGTKNSSFCPKINERAFVLKPWSDIAPDYKLPEINKTISELISNLDISSNIIKLYNKSL